MKSLTKKEWIAVAVSLTVIAFFFIVGSRIVSFFNINPEKSNMNLGAVESSQGASNLQIEDSVLGTGKEAVNGSKLTVHYTGTFANGVKFDSSVDRGTPFEFTIGTGSVIKGWDQGLLGMKVGGKRKLTIPPNLGYGGEAIGPIPANSTLIFEVELLDVSPSK